MNLSEIKFARNKNLGQIKFVPNKNMCKIKFVQNKICAKKICAKLNLFKFVPIKMCAKLNSCQIKCVPNKIWFANNLCPINLYEIRFMPNTNCEPMSHIRVVSDKIVSNKFIVAQYKNCASIRLCHNILCNNKFVPHNIFTESGSNNMF